MLTKLAYYFINNQINFAVGIFLLKRFVFDNVLCVLK